MKILLIISGSIACYKSFDMIRLLLNQDIQLSIVMTKSAAKMISPSMVSAMANVEVFTEENIHKLHPMGHIYLSRNVDAILVMPASANIINKSASGISDELAYQIILARKLNTALIFVPAMNCAMYESPITQRNIEILEKIPHTYILPTQFGKMACNEIGWGKILQIETIYEYLLHYIYLTHLSKEDSMILNAKIVINLGGTNCRIDSVRYIGNYSSGLQGIEIARAIFQAGFKSITLLVGNISPSVSQILSILPEEISIIESNTFEDMYTNSVKYGANANIFIAAAAISDYSPAKISNRKIKKNENFNSIDLQENKDILKTLSTLSQRPNYLIGFAAESENHIEYGLSKMRSKNLDMIIVNDVSAMNSDSNSVSILYYKEDQQIANETLESNSKANIASNIVKILWKKF